jgi:endonuclease/exonuclease/phosphatase family metal-dependent hydrolase
VTGRRLSFPHLFILLLILSGTSGRVSAQTQPGDVVLYASQATVRVGNWSVISDPTAAGGLRLTNVDAGLAKITTPLPSPVSYAELSFNAVAGLPYRLWIRGKTPGDSPYNDSVYVQFSGSVDANGAPVNRINTTSATVINLEEWLDYGLRGWGWQDNGWGLGILGSEIYFQTTGPQTIRIQPREDGILIDQIVLSPTTFRFASPGALWNDTVILPLSALPPTPTPTPTPTPVPTPTPGQIPSDVVIWASDVTSSSIHGNWFREANGTAANQIALHNPDQAAPKLGAPLGSPANYFDIAFPAIAGRAYRLWIRGRADNDYWGNDSIFAQFSGSVDAFGNAAYRIGTTNGLAVNLEDCSGCGLQGWGWQDPGWGIGVLGPVLYFPTTGTQTLRIQTREDGFAIDQIVIASAAYLNTSPGKLINDNLILSHNLGGGNQSPVTNASATPTSGTSPLFVSFFANASDPDGYIASYAWNFGDGTTSSLANPVKTYQSAGNFLAQLTVTDNIGAVGTSSVSVVVNSPPPTPTPTPTPTPPPPPSGTTLKVLSWNIAFGQGTDAIKDYNRTATWIANINPDIAALCEVPPSDIPSLVSSINQKTGRTWYYHFVPKYPGCPEGNLILSKYNFVSVSSLYLSYNRSVAQATINVGGRNVNFFATHLDDGSSTARYAEVGELLNWAGGFADSKIFAGDFNGGPDTSEVGRMVGSTFDSWNEAINSGTAVAYADNPVVWMTRTRRGRIDYVFYARSSSSLVLKSAQIPDSRDLSNKNVAVWLGTSDDKGVRPSDHNQMIATFEVR